MLSKENIDNIKKSCRYKEQEVDLLSYFLQPQIELMMPAIIIEGAPSSGKTYTLTKYLEALKEHHNIGYIVIECDYCFTQREILRKIHKSLMVHYELAFTSVEKEIMECDGLGSFPGSLKQMVQFYRQYTDGHVQRKPVVIVLDRVDRLSKYENPGELVRCMSKLHEQSDGDDLNDFCFISVVTRNDFLDIGTSSIPIIKFENYNLDQFKNIICLKFTDNFWSVINGWNDKYDDESEDEDDEDKNMDELNVGKIKLKITDTEKTLFFRQFVDVILNTYSGYVGLSLEVVVPILRRIWPIFIDPVIRKGHIAKGANDVFTTFMKNKNIFGREFSVVTRLDNSDMSLLDYEKKKLLLQVGGGVDVDTEHKKGHYDLSVKTKYLVIAAFLASYNEPKYDRQFFSKGNQYNSIVKQRAKRFKASDKGDGKLRRDLSAALPFKLERLLAILNSIWSENIGESEAELFDDVELMSEIATLSSLKTLIKLKNGDTIGGQTKWKCNVHWNVVKKFAADVGFAIDNHLQD